MHNLHLDEWFYSKNVFDIMKITLESIREALAMDTFYYFLEKCVSPSIFVTTCDRLCV
jgi:hypothetical protein